VVTVAQRSYSFGLLEVYGTKFSGTRFLNAPRDHRMRSETPYQIVPQGF